MASIRALFSLMDNIVCFVSITMIEMVKLKSKVYVIAMKYTKQSDDKGIQSKYCIREKVIIVPTGEETIYIGCIKLNGMNHLVCGS